MLYTVEKSDIAWLTQLLNKNNETYYITTEMNQLIEAT